MTSIQHIIERQLQRWNLEQARRREALEKLPQQPPARAPWITIARQAGAGGEEVAARLAEALGYEIFDRQIVEALVEHSDFRSATLEALDEKEQSWVTVYLEGLLRGRALHRTDYARHLMQTVISIAQHGRAIILGRGSALILDPAGGLNVRLVASPAVREEAMARDRGTTLEEARRVVREIDADRAHFVEKYFGADVSDSSHYDLVLNTGTLGVLPTVHLIQIALREKLAGRADSLKELGKEEHGS